jgi:hypothetical protein
MKFRSEHRYKTLRSHRVLTKELSGSSILPVILRFTGRGSSMSDGRMIDGVSDDFVEMLTLFCVIEMNIFVKFSSKFPFYSHQMSSASLRS